MKIVWDKTPVTPEEKMLARFVAGHQNLFIELAAESDHHDLLTASLTPKPLGRGFFTFELKKRCSSGTYDIIVWRGVRTGDATPILIGNLKGLPSKAFKGQQETAI